jgi:hypothetical protein
MMITLLAAFAHAVPAKDGPPIEVVADVSVHGQAFLAPEIPGVQDWRVMLLPVIEGEGEIRQGAWAIRGRAGLFPIPFVLDAGIMGLRYQGNDSFIGLELGASRAYRHNRVYAGPTVGVRGPWRLGALTGVAGVRLTTGLSFDAGERTDWVFLSPGPAVGAHVGLAFTFAPE